MSKASIAIIGADTFIGRHLADSLAQTEFEIKRVPLATTPVGRNSPQAGLDLADSQAVIFTSPPTGAGNLKTAKQTAVDHVRQILDAAIEGDVARVVYISSAITTWDTSAPEPYGEDDFYVPGSTDSNFAEVQAFCEAELYRYLSRGLPIIPVLPSLAIGPGRRPEAIFRLLCSGRLPLQLTGETEVVDVRDVGRAAKTALLEGRPGRRYIVRGHRIDTAELCDKFSRSAKRPALETKFPGVALSGVLQRIDTLTARILGRDHGLGDQMTQLCQFPPLKSNRAEAELNHTPNSLEKTISETVEFYLSG